MVVGHNIDEISRTRDIQITQDITFDSMFLSPLTLKGLKQSGFYKPSPIQLHGIPLGKCGFDLILEAKSGTGKTAVFSVIALEKLDLQKGLQVVILAPTREIASQICDVLKEIGLFYADLAVAVVMGGLPIEEDICKFKKTVHIVVASPGRLRHLIQDRHIDVTSVRLLVLDEADKLMEKSFIADINYIFSTISYQKQVILSSATYPETTKTFVNKYVNNGQHVCPNSNCILLGVEQKITIVKYNTNIVRQTQYRFEELLKILSQKSFKQCLIFCNYQARVVELHKLLKREKWPVEQLYGRQEQTDRLDALKTLQEYKCRILISTDLAARGIDASNVDLVINFEAPFEWPTYLHRIGRAGRYGSYGMSVTILSRGKEEEKFKSILETMKDSLNINNFWNNEKLNLDSKNDKINNNTPTDNSLHLKKHIEEPDILNKLINETNNSLVDTFEILCKYYEETNDTNLTKGSLESFKELMTSFESNNIQQGLQDSTYQHKKIKPVPLALNSIKSSNFTNSEFNSSKKIQSCQINLNKDIESDTFSKNVSLIKIPKNEIKCQDISTDSKVEDDYSKAMLDFGLPLSFGSSKTHTTNDFKINVASKNYPSTDFQTKVTSNLKKKDMNEELKTKKPSEQHCKVKEIDCNRNRFVTCTKKLYQSKRNSKAGSHPNKAFTSKKGDYYISIDYVNWYKQLKLHVRQIEYSFYIDEVSKLNK